MRECNFLKELKWLAPKYLVWTKYSLSIAWAFSSFSLSSNTLSYIIHAYASFFYLHSDFTSDSCFILLFYFFEYFAVIQLCFYLFYCLNWFHNFQLKLSLSMFDLKEQRHGYEFRSYWIFVFSNFWIIWVFSVEHEWIHFDWCSLLLCGSWMNSLKLQLLLHP